MQIESSVKNDGHIWVLTSTLRLDHYNLEHVILDNLGKGIHYKYFIPLTDGHLQTKMRNLAGNWQKAKKLSDANAKEQIECYLVPEHFCYMTVIVYGPLDDIPTVLVFPPGDAFEKEIVKEKYPLIYRFDAKPKDAWKTFVYALEKMEKECKEVKPLEIDFKNL